MKANELMIGDLVYYEHTEDGVTPYKEVIIIAPEDIAEDDCILEAHYSPIPLTAEILEKNGFVKKESYLAIGPYLRYELSCNNYRIVVAPKPNKTWSLECLTTKNIPQVRLYIECVHELQRALKMCEIDKEITV